MKNKCKISGFRCEVDENCSPFSYYAVCSGNSLPVMNYHYMLCSSKEARRLKASEASLTKINMSDLSLSSQKV